MELKFPLEGEYLAEIRQRYFKHLADQYPDDNYYVPPNSSFLNRPLHEDDLPALSLEIATLKQKNLLLANSEDERVFYAETRLDVVRQFCVREAERLTTVPESKAAYRVVIHKIDRVKSDV